MLNILNNQLDIIYFDLIHSSCQFLWLFVLHIVWNELMRGACTANHRGSCYTCIDTGPRCLRPRPMDHPIYGVFYARYRCTEDLF